MFQIRQKIKMLLQNVWLPLLYRICCLFTKVEKGRILFLDAHHEEIPFSMRRIYEELCRQKVKNPQRIRSLQVECRDYNKISYSRLPFYLARIMAQIARAEVIMICDYCLPVSACKKRPGTRVIQLWHSCGLMKKIAYDTGEDIPADYRGNMFGNYDLLTVSAPICVPVHIRALRLDPEKVRAVGVSRTDYYFDADWNAACRKRFLEQVPQAKGKKILLWAPTFRGNAAAPRLEGLSAVIQAGKELEQEGYYLIIKAHPHIDAKQRISNCSLPTEELLCVADLLITDYSSVLFDYLIYEKPVLLYAQDWKDYEKLRGFYIDFRKMPFPLVEDGSILAEGIRNSFTAPGNDPEILRQWKRTYTGACDGHATQRILSLSGLFKEKGE